MRLVFGSVVCLLLFGASLIYLPTTDGQETVDGTNCTLESPRKANATTFTQYVTIEWFPIMEDLGCNITVLSIGCGTDEDQNVFLQNFTVSISSSNIVTNITGLEQNSVYNCHAIFINDDGEQSTVTTFPIETEAAHRIKIDVIPYETALYLNWSIDNYSSDRLQYTIILVSIGPDHYVPEDCQGNNTLYEENINTTEVHFNYTKAFPDFTYQIEIVAYYNKDGPLITSGEVYLDTLSTAPSEPRNLSNTDPTLNDNIISSKLSWEMPCSPNGVITEFVVTSRATYGETGEVFNHTYTVGVNISSPGDTFSLKLNNLCAASTYHITVYAVGRPNITGNASELTFHTPDKLPTAPTDITFQAESRLFNISWSPPDGRFGKIVSYTVNISSVEPVYEYDNLSCANEHKVHFKTEELSAENTSMTFHGARPYYKYHIIVAASTSAGQGESGVGNVQTLTEIPENPYNITIEYQDGLIYTLNWTTPCYINGDITGFVISKAGNYTEDSKLGDSDTFSTTFLSGQYNYNHSIVLRESYSYNVSVSVIITDSNNDSITGNETMVTKITDPGIPGVPTLLHTESYNIDQSFTLTWSPPENKNGRIEGYEIKMVALSPIYQILQNCSMVNLATFETSTLNTSVYIDLGQVSKFYHSFNYSIAVRANTTRGYGDYLEMFAVSIDGEPEIFNVSKANIVISKSETYDGKAEITFYPPCFLNGPFSNFTLDYGARDGFNGYKLQNKTHKFDLSTFDFTFPLEPDLQYFYNVTLYTASHERTVRGESFMSPGGVPEVVISPQEIPFRLKDTEAEVTLNKSYFENPNGKVRYVALILSDKNVTGGEYEEYESDSWPNITNDDAEVYYQLTEDRWEPFKDDDIATFTIGDGPKSCLDNVTYCNKPLEPNTEYYLIVRSFTSNFYRNSQPIHFKTRNLSKVALIVGLTMGALGTAIVGFVYFLWKRKRIHIPKILYIKSSSNGDTPRNSSTSYPVKKFIHYCKHLENNPEKLKEQYQLLAERTKECTSQLSTNFACLVENRRKNRYINILPFDDTRVKLLIDEDDDLGSDYINASYIKGYSGQSEYIATQGPLETTCRDFWKMILQENVTVIVMVSQFIEQDKEKCYRYFPRNRETMLVDDIEVRCCTELHFGIYCVRTIQVAKDSIQTSVVHMQFLEWPDFGVPVGTEHMLQFCYQLRRRMKMEGGCTVVHCSAGVGRTGTLIATDILLQTANAGKDLDVFHTVLELRKQRVNMVQTEKQYIYIHNLIKDHLGRPPTPDVIENVPPIYENLSVLQERSEENNQRKKEQESHF